MSGEAIQTYVSVAGLLLAIIGLPILFGQIRELQRSVRSGAHAAIYAQAADFRSHLVEHPHLRKYFFGGVEITPDHPDYERVVTLAEPLLNYLEHMAVMKDSFGRRNRESLDRFARSAFDRSPIMRRWLAENEESYSDALRSSRLGSASANADPG